MWEWEEKSHSYIFMIQQIITSALILTAPLNANLTSMNGANTFINKNNIQDNLVYDQNNLLETHEQLGILNFKSAPYGSNLSMDARSIYYINEDKEFDHYQYKEMILIRKNLLGTLNVQSINYQIRVNTTNAWAMINPNEPENVKIGYLSTLNSQQLAFLEGQNYTTYSDLNTIYQNILTNITPINDMLTTDNISYNYQTNYDYVVIQIDLEWQDNLIQYNGAFMYTMNAPVMTINETIYYETPEITGYEVIDIPGLLFTILGMPFAWISTAFNFTIFPGTIYEVNPSAILMAIIIGLIAIYIAKKIIK